MTKTFSIEEILPHRERMKLLNDIINVEDGSAVTRAHASEQWPLYHDGSIDPLIIIELVAQTAGIAIGAEAMKKESKKPDDGGWLVGIKHAHILIDKISVQSILITSVRRTFEQESYSLFDGEVSLDNRIIGTVSIQIMRSGSAMLEQE